MSLPVACRCVPICHACEMVATLIATLLAAIWPVNGRARAPSASCLGGLTGRRRRTFLTWWNGQSGDGRGEAWQRQRAERRVTVHTVPDCGLVLTPNSSDSHQAHLTLSPLSSVVSASPGVWCSCSPISLCSPRTCLCCISAIVITSNPSGLSFNEHIFLWNMSIWLIFIIYGTIYRFLASWSFLDILHFLNVNSILFAVLLKNYVFFRSDTFQNVFMTLLYALNIWSDFIMRHLWTNSYSSIFSHSSINVFIPQSKL